MPDKLYYLGLINDADSEATLETIKHLSALDKEITLSLHGDIITAVSIKRKQMKDSYGTGTGHK